MRYLSCAHCYPEGLPMVTYSDKDLNRAEDIRQEMIGPRCQDCGGVGPNAPKWAGEEYGWCYCTEEEPQDAN